MDYMDINIYQVKDGGLKVWVGHATARKSADSLVIESEADLERDFWIGLEWALEDGLESSEIEIDENLTYCWSVKES